MSCVTALGGEVDESDVVFGREDNFDGRRACVEIQPPSRGLFDLLERLACNPERDDSITLWTYQDRPAGLALAGEKAAHVPMHRKNGKRPAPTASEMRAWSN